MNNKLKVELFWWVISLMIIAIMLIPLSSGFDLSYLALSMFFGIVTFTYFRYLIFFKQTPLYPNKELKKILLIANISILVSLVFCIQKFNGYVNSIELWKLQQNESLIWEAKTTMNYFLRLNLLLATSSIIITSLLQLRIFYSLWQDHRVEKHPLA